MMTKKQFNELSLYEQTFKEADSGYYRTLLRSDVETISVIYESLGYSIESKSCNRCILAMLQNLSKEYNAYKNKLKKKDDTLL